MKIVTIFAETLFAFHFTNEKQNELERLLDLWNDVSYLHRFVKDNRSDLPKNESIQQVIEEILESAASIDDSLISYSTNKRSTLDEFFKPLDNKEYRIKTLSKQKSRCAYLRLYALRIDANCFIITGGAIKFHHLMEDRPHTATELKKIERCRDYLKTNNITDNDSFYEFLIEVV